MPDPSTDLRDQLAIDRTVLANERTLMSFGRTGLASIAGGVGLAHLYGNAAIKAIAGGLVVLGVVIVIAGGVRYARVRRRLAALAARPR